MKKCPYCSGSGTLYFGINSRRYFRCFACDLIYQTSSRSYYDVVATYRKEYFGRYSADQLQGGRNKLHDHILEKIAGNSGGGSLLDVGTGCGHFLLMAHRRGWQVQGIEPSLQSAQMAREQDSLNVFYGTLDKYCGSALFDLITFINVLDHSAMPWVEISRANELLRPGGLIYLRFPNGFFHSEIYRMSQKARLSKSLRKFLVFHIYSFTPRYIRKLLSDHGFSQIKILNSPPSFGDPHEIFPSPIFASCVKRVIYFIAKFTEKMSRGRSFIGTSLEVTAVKSENPHN